MANNDMFHFLDPMDLFIGRKFLNVFFISSFQFFSQKLFKTIFSLSRMICYSHNLETIRKYILQI